MVMGYYGLPDPRREGQERSCLLHGRVRQFLSVPSRSEAFPEEGDRKSGEIARRSVPGIGQPAGRKKIAQRFIAG